MTKDNVNSPSHYTQAGIECIDAITAAVSGKSGIEAVCVANVIKYLWRYELKNGGEDVRKAQWYLNRLVSEMDAVAECKHTWSHALGDSFDTCIHCKATRPTEVAYEPRN